MSTFTAEEFNRLAAGRFPGHLGMEVTRIAGRAVHAALELGAHHMAPNGFLHAGAVVTLADTCCGAGCLANLPQGATGFTTIELKSNHLGTAREGSIECVASAVHLGRTTQVWDAVVTDRGSGRTIALFRCTQMLLYRTGDS